MSDDEDDLIDLDEAWESPPMSPHERALWGGRDGIANSKTFLDFFGAHITTNSSFRSIKYESGWQCG